MKLIFYTLVGYSKRPECEVHRSDISKYGFGFEGSGQDPSPLFGQKPKFCTFFLMLPLCNSQKSQICKEHPWYNFSKCHYGKKIEGTQK